MNLAIRVGFFLLFILSFGYLNANVLDKSLEIFQKKDCFTVEFSQDNLFHGSVKHYEGFLIRKKNIVKVVYLTNPPFVVFSDGTYITLGYEGARKKTYKVDKYPNPLVRVLLNLDRLKNAFRVESCEGNICRLKPKGKLGNLKEILVHFKGERIATIEVVGDRKGRNRVVIKIKRVLNRCPVSSVKFKGF
jgi:outer membrane lipoprotein-sorting protein